MALAANEEPKVEWGRGIDAFLCDCQDAGPVRRFHCTPPGLAHGPDVRPRSWWGASIAVPYHPPIGSVFPAQDIAQQLLRE
mmetsp:Transcript_74281/g.223252  ORF Transcript_74281/g.223252 Transcript_74281/m.223252 type:complete len:81 (+) Transcript_74281:185-427(+)